MRLGEVFGTPVVDRSGRRLGKVHDARLIDDGGLRVDGLVVGDGALAVRLGYHRNRVTGPWLLRALAQRIEHRTRYVAWGDIDSISPSVVVRLRCGADDLPFLRDIE